MRIVAGRHRGLALEPPADARIRPTADRVRQAIFDVLEHRFGLGAASPLRGAVVLDVFCGSGAMGIEALSRGAARVLFVEKNGKALDVLGDNLRMLGDHAEDRACLVRGDAWEPPALGDSQPAPNLIFLDPPYAMVEEDPVKSIYRARQLAHRLAPGGCLVFHFEAGVLEEDDFDDDLFVDLRQWGGSAIAFVWRQGEVPERVLRRRERDALRNGDADEASGTDDASDAANTADAPGEADDAS
jgi:16S rRNA (guanine966-N2)-methyltransferase